MAGTRFLVSGKYSYGIRFLKSLITRTLKGGVTQTKPVVRPFDRLRAGFAHQSPARAKEKIDFLQPDLVS